MRIVPIQEKIWLNGSSCVGHISAVTKREKLIFYVPLDPPLPPPMLGWWENIPILTNPTGPQIAVLDHSHKIIVRIRKYYLAVDKALKQQLLGCINKIYYRILPNRHTGYAIVFRRQIITYLYAQYGNITPQDLQENITKMKTPFDVSLRIETLYDQIEDGIDLSDAEQTPYTAEQVVAIIYSLVFATGSFPDAYREWKRTGTGHKTWTNFKVDLDLAFKEMRESQLTSQGAGFSAQNANAVADFRAKTVEAIENSGKCDNYG